MEGQRFCGSEDPGPVLLLGEKEENRAEVNFLLQSHIFHCVVLSQAVPAVPFLIEQLSKALNMGWIGLEEKEEALKKFRQILSFLELPRKDPPETVRS